jgi:hypothetical protein
LEVQLPVDNLRRERLRFDDFQLERFPNGRCMARVGLQWTRGRSFSGEAEGTQTKQGELQAAAKAALAAAGESVQGRVALELRGVKAVRAFDAWVVVASVSARVDNLDIRLLGAFPSPGPDTSRGAVLAVLDATNRVLQRYLED